MQNKKLMIIMGLLVLVVGAAAFVGGRMLNGGVNPLGLLGMPMAGAGPMSVSISLKPAPELPTTDPEVLGLFAERQDNTLFVQTFSMDKGGGGVVISSSADGEGGDGEAVAGSPIDTNSGPKVEVVITNDTIIYRETTEISGPPSGNQTVQQTVEESTLDQLTTESFVTVWGRKSADRVIADVLFYSNPVMFKRP
ncbi:MAG: hypothetical protein ABIQ77_03580 [Anaerolineales bacterium]